MTKPIYRNGKEPAKPQAVKNVGKRRPYVRWFLPVVPILRDRFPGKKLEHELALRAGRSTRVCEKWIGGHGGPDGEALYSLINSDIGDVVWLALTKGCNEPWRKKLNRQIEISQLRDMQRETVARLAALEGES